MSKSFFEQINYASATEDTQAELAALNLNSNDQVLCITASGARPLDLIAASNASIDAVDFSAPQTYLLELKVQAYREFEFSDFQELMGLVGSKDRLGLANRLFPSLSPDARQFWSRNPNLIRSGLLYCGTWEKLLWWISRTTVVRDRHVKNLLAAKDLETQIDYWNRYWSGGFLKMFLRGLCLRFLWTHIIREPGAKLIPANFDVAGYLHSCLTRMAHHSLLRENPYANLLFYGRYTDQCELPIHLQPAHFEGIRERLPNLRWFTAGLEEHLNGRPRQYSAFSLSDFSSYATEIQHRAIWEGIVKNAVENAGDGAKFCERHFLVKRESVHQHVRRDRELEERLFKTDHTCLYTFHAGTIGRGTIATVTG